MTQPETISRRVKTEKVSLASSKTLDWNIARQSSSSHIIVSDNVVRHSPSCSDHAWPHTAPNASTSNDRHTLQLIDG